MMTGVKLCSLSLDSRMTQISFVENLTHQESKKSQSKHCRRLARRLTQARRSEWLRECVMTNCRKDFLRQFAFLALGST